jgi:hypothetical protein
VGLPGAADPLAIGELVAAAVPLGIVALTSTSDDLTAWYADCDKAGPGVTDARAWEIRAFTSCGVIGLDPGAIDPYRVMATSAAATPSENTDAQRAGVRNRPRWGFRRRRGRLSVVSASSNSDMKHVVSRSITGPDVGSSRTFR